MADMNGTGQWGKTLEERQLAGKVRQLGLNQLYEILNEGTWNKKKVDKTFKEAIMLRLASTLLPRLNEHSGPDGGPIQIQGNEIKIKQYGES